MGEPFRILASDRNPHVREFLQRELVSDGFEVDVAGNGEELLGMICGGTFPDLVILDLDLPYSGGLDLLDRIRECRPALPVVIHTFLAENSQGDRNDIDAGAFVEKDGNMDILRRVIRELLSRCYPERAGSNRTDGA